MQQQQSNGMERLERLIAAAAAVRARSSWQFAMGLVGCSSSKVMHWKR
jgi:hypothetical protein